MIERDHELLVSNAADFGVPQRRRRKILLAARSAKPDFAQPIKKGLIRVFVKSRRAGRAVVLPSAQASRIGCAAGSRGDNPQGLAQYLGALMGTILRLYRHDARTLEMLLSLTWLRRSTNEARIR
jgi:site-specific DNA-cytosine methylase